ncbi:MAG: hypothetical protein J2P57_21290, partial [Acidimicrobiaceae bacterium]|nr:hypothetical protein [Acidimicrobiaceae bacterium]
PSEGLQVGSVAIRLLFEHRVGPPGEPLLLDANGVPFANEGDQVVCCGGFAPGSPVRGTRGIFTVGQITRISRATSPPEPD